MLIQSTMYRYLLQAYIKNNFKTNYYENINIANATYKVLYQNVRSHNQKLQIL